MKRLSKSEAEDAYMQAYREFKALKEQLATQEAELKKLFGLSDLDILILRKRTEPQPELWEWLSK